MALASFARLSQAEDAETGARSHTAYDESKLPCWAKGEPRAFLAGRAIAGSGFGRVALAAGYGKPHWLWAGPEVVGFVSPFYAAWSGGIHVRAAIVDLTILWRRTYSFEFGTLPAARSVSSAELRSSPGRARYYSLDARLSGFLPISRLLIAWEVTYIRPIDLAASPLVYEEAQRIVIGSRGLVTTKLTPMVRVLTARDFYAGLFAEHLSLLGRPDSLVFRLGPSLYLTLSDHWDAMGFASWPLLGADSLGAWDGMYGAIAARYRFATQEARGGPR